MKSRAAEVDVLAEREQMITQVEATLGEVGDIFMELGELVHAQGKHIDHISSSIENTAAQAGRATEELLTASRYQNRARGRACCLTVGLVVGAVCFIVAGLALRV